MAETGSLTLAFMLASAIPASSSAAEKSAPSSVPIEPASPTTRSTCSLRLARPGPSNEAQMASESSDVKSPSSSRDVLTSSTTLTVPPVDRHPSDESKAASRKKVVRTMYTAVSALSRRVRKHVVAAWPSVTHSAEAIVHAWRAGPSDAPNTVACRTASGMRLGCMPQHTKLTAKLRALKCHIEQRGSSPDDNVSSGGLGELRELVAAALAAVVVLYG